MSGILQGLLAALAARAQEISLYAWGQNTSPFGSGMLGLNDIIDRSSPVQVGGSTDWYKLSLPNTNSYATPNSAIKADGSLWTWGINNQGACGLGDTIDRSSPTQVGALTNWAQATSTFWTMGAVKTDGTLWTWGAGLNGLLGRNTAVYSSSPVQVGSLTNWAQIAMGSSAIAVKTDGTLWSWGSNSTGQLGVNSIVDNRSSPIQVGALTNWAAGYAGGSPFIVCRKTDGTLWSWGFNGAQFTLGHGDMIRRSSPVQIGVSTDWAQVSPGNIHSLAVKTNGTLWAWGFGEAGAIGDGQRISRSIPVQIGALTTWAQASAGGGGGHSVAVKIDGTLWSWGQNNNGQLGLNDRVYRSSPVQVGALATWSAVSAARRSTFALELI